MKPVVLHEENLISIEPAEPLWQRVPTRDDDGRLLGDFMMVIPGLNKFQDEKIQYIIDTFNKVLKLYCDYVVYADLNLKINLLWVSHRHHHGIGSELAAALHCAIPEAKLVAQKYE